MIETKIAADKGGQFGAAWDGVCYNLTIDVIKAFPDDLWSGAVLSQNMT